MGKIDLRKQRCGIVVEGHRGTWYVINMTKDGRYFLLESEIFGDEAPCLIVTPTGRIKMENVWNGLSELDY